jgi:hypothetical protein
VAEAMAQRHVTGNDLPVLRGMRDLSINFRENGFFFCFFLQPLSPAFRYSMQSSYTQ